MIAGFIGRLIVQVGRMGRYPPRSLILWNKPIELRQWLCHDDSIVVLLSLSSLLLPAIFFIFRRQIFRFAKLYSLTDNIGFVLAVGTARRWEGGNEIAAWFKSLRCINQKPSLEIARTTVATWIFAHYLFTASNSALLFSHGRSSHQLLGLFSSSDLERWSATLTF